MVAHVQPKPGDVIGHWRVKAYVGADKFNKARYECQCSCGKWKFVLASELANGKSTSCGCQRQAWREQMKHGIIQAGWLAKYPRLDAGFWMPVLARMKETGCTVDEAVEALKIEKRKINEVRKRHVSK